MTEETTEFGEIIREIRLLKEKISHAEERLKEAGLRQLGLKVGDLIEVEGMGIVHVDGCDNLGWLGRPVPIGRKIKKDGTVGQQSAGYLATKEWRKL